MDRHFNCQFPQQVEIVEVGASDGLQRETAIVPLEEKVAIVKALVAAGMKQGQITSSVSPQLVLQMADAEPWCALLPFRGEPSAAGSP
jgi:hydroxymethylglutaryl-CoA lyase